MNSLDFKTELDNETDYDDFITKKYNVYNNDSIGIFKNEVDLKLFLKLYLKKYIIDKNTKVTIDINDKNFGYVIYKIKYTFDNIDVYIIIDKIRVENKLHTPEHLKKVKKKYTSFIHRLINDVISTENHNKKYFTSHPRHNDYLLI